jgi:DNA polymerase sigma
VKVLQGVKWVVEGMALVVLISTSSTASEKTRFYVECYTSGSAAGDTSKEYAYRLRSQGFPEPVDNGININLDEKKILLSVESKRSGQEEYSKLYTDMPLVKRNEQPCENGKCQKVDYEPKDFKETLVVTYDKDNGGMSIKHAIAPGNLVEARGGCLFVALPTKD